MEINIFMKKYATIADFETKITIQSLEKDVFESKRLRVLVQREDLLNPDLAGNKWRKLKYNLIKAKELNCTSLLTFGGAYSNHIAATASAGQIFGFKTIGVIRGEAPAELNKTLQNAKSQGMELHFVSRSSYRDKSKLSHLFLQKYPNAYLVPEGGTNKFALKGCQEIIENCPLAEEIDYFCVASGTGGTAAGMIQALPKQSSLISFSVLKGDFIKRNISTILGEDQFDNWTVNNDFHFGGYAKFNQGLIDFINSFKKQYKIALDPVYTGKLFYGVFDLIRKDYFPIGSTIVIVHTGGQQGIEGFNDRFGNIIQ